MTLKIQLIIGTPCREESKRVHEEIVMLLYPVQTIYFPLVVLYIKILWISMHSSTDAIFLMAFTGAGVRNGCLLFFFFFFFFVDKYAQQHIYHLFNDFYWG